GCKHFSRANEWLQQKGLPTVDWSLPNKSELLEKYGKSQSKE
ncbi:MAG: uracil-DNA glycosylase, partial [Marinobacter sp.]|nr:uracil-DNA glycosylase [Marinobacter sp.]